MAHPPLTFEHPIWEILDPPLDIWGKYCRLNHRKSQLFTATQQKFKNHAIPSAQSNKCYKVVIPAEGSGYTWHDALAICRDGPGFLPDLASIANADEQGY